MPLLPARALLLAACAAAPLFAAQAPEEVQSQVQLESAQEARLQNVLRRVLNTDDVLVIVDMDVAADSRQRLTELLPGVPLKDTPVAADLPSVTRSTVKSMAATVILDESLDKDVDALVQKTAEEVLSLDLARGDTVTVKRMRLKPQLVARSAARDWLTPAPVVSLLWLLAALAALAVLYSAFLRPFLGALREVGIARAAPAPAAPAGGLIEPATDKMPPLAAEAAAPLAPAAAGDEALPFAFLRERHVPMLKFLLRRAPAKTAAVIVHYLPARLAVDVLGALPSETRQGVAQAMSRVVQLDEDNVRQIEDSLRARIDYLMGGEDKLAEILDQAPPALQDELLAAVRGEDAEAAARLAGRVVRLEDVGLLDANDLKTLSRRVPIRSLAAVLRSTEGLRERVLPKLTSGLGAWLSQEVELAGVLSGDRLAAEQRRVLGVLTQLVREGTVKLVREAAPPPALEHAPPEPAEAPAAPQG